MRISESTAPAALVRGGEGQSSIRRQFVLRVEPADVLTLFQQRADFTRQRTGRIEFRHLQVPMEIADAFQRDLARRIVDMIDAHDTRAGINQRQLLAMFAQRRRQRDQLSAGTGAAAGGDDTWPPPGRWPPPAPPCPKPSEHQPPQLSCVTRSCWDMGDWALKAILRAAKPIQEKCYCSWPTMPNLPPAAAPPARPATAQLRAKWAAPRADANSILLN